MTNIGFDRIRDLTEPFKEYMWKIEFADLPNDIQDDAEDVALQAQTTELPGREFGEITRSFFNYTIRSAGKPSQEGTIDITFYQNASLVVKDFFDNWQNLINDVETGAGSPAEDYMAVMSMLPLNDRDPDSNEAEIITERELQLVYPQSVGNISLDQTGDSNATIDVTMSYSNIITL